MQEIEGAVSYPYEEALARARDYWAQNYRDGVDWKCSFCGTPFTSPEVWIDHFTDNDGRYWQLRGTWCRGTDPTLEPKMLDEPWQGPVELDPPYMAWLYACLAGSPEWLDPTRR